MNAMSKFLSRTLLTLATLSVMSTAAMAAPQPPPPAPANTAISFEYYDGLLLVTGTDEGEEITISGNQIDGLEISVSSLPGTLMLAPGMVTEVEVDAGAGDDRVTNESDVPMTVFGGAGVDVLTGAADDICVDEGATITCNDGADPASTSKWDLVMGETT